MNTYEPELMFAYDSHNEYADLKNVYNVTGDDICYCPICLGRVKLWNGQDPNRTYLKQKCFHHIDGMCSQESRVHFAYKTWLIEENSKFKVGDELYEVKSVKLEQTLKTTYGNYRPDIIVETVNDKTFYIEIADTNKKTDEYILKWDELGNDVIEINVNEQLSCVSTKDVPIFNLIYSANTGQCFIKRYIKQDYDDIFTERKMYWKRKDLLNYKIKWENLDWFWYILQEYYVGKITIDDVCDNFKNIDFEDQKFICSRFKNGKHKEIKYELEKHYSNKDELKKVHLKHMSNVVRKLNNEFGYSTSCIPYLCRQGRWLAFKTNYYSNNIDFYIKDDTSEQDIYDYFYGKMKTYYEDNKKRILKEQQSRLKRKNKIKLLTTSCDLIFGELERRINNSCNRLWYISIKYSNACNGYYVNLRLAKHWEYTYYFNIDDIENNYNGNTLKEYIISKTLKEMNYMLNDALVGKRTVRLLEVK